MVAVWRNQEIPPAVSELSPEDVFKLHPKIRWAGLSTDQGEVVFVRMRPGVKSLSPENADQSFMQMGPLLLSGVCERIAPWAGQLETIVIRYESVIMLVTKLEKRYLALTVNKTESPETVLEITKSVVALTP